jgi:hypothetical protein
LKRLTEDELRSLTQSYERLVAAGREAPPPNVPEQVQKQARNLLRLERRREEVLRFLMDFAVLFDNN